jgi:cysteine desulfurase
MAQTMERETAGAAAAPVYLDHNATTPLLDEALEAMLPFLRHHFGNPSSGHAFGRRTRAAIEAARAQVASLVGAQPDEVIFTSGGTESSNLAIAGVAAAAAPGRRAVVTTVVDHPATRATCAALRGWVVREAPVDGACRIDLPSARRMLDHAVALVTVMHANNETGALQPVAELADAAHAVGATVHVDGAQSVGKVPVDMGALGADLLTVVGHKLGGPQGVGALVIRRGVRLDAISHGAGHERGLRPGTENVAGIVGLGAACAVVQRSLDHEARRVRALREDLFARLAAVVPGLARSVPDADGAASLPNTLHVRFPGVAGDEVLSAAPDVAASTGSACHAGGPRRASAVVQAMGVPEGEALGSVRLSLGRSTTADDVARAAEALAAAWSSRRARS